MAYKKCGLLQVVRIPCFVFHPAVILAVAAAVAHSVDRSAVEPASAFCASAVPIVSSPTNAGAGVFFGVLQNHPAHVSSSSDLVYHEWPAPGTSVGSHNCLPVPLQRN